MIEKLKDFYRTFFKLYSKKSYSQEGEDLLLNRLFGDNYPKGFFIDVGAHHPRRFSNTYWFYKLGWTGINIDPNPISIQAFNFVRKRDININVGVSDNKGELQYFMFNDAALNTFDLNLANERNNEKYHLIEKRTVSVLPLSEILNEYKIPEVIDFISVDVEGFDLEVLKSNDWNKYRPKYLLVEILESDILKLADDDIYKFLHNNGYKLISKLVHTCVFQDTKKA